MTQNYIKQPEFVEGGLARAKMSSRVYSVIKVFEDVDGVQRLILRRIGFTKRRCREFFAEQASHTPVIEATPELITAQKSEASKRGHETKRRKRIAALATKLVAEFKVQHTDGAFKYDILDRLSEPLINQLFADGVIPNGDSAFVEWQGVYEFGIVPICSGGLWFNVKQSGDVDSFGKAE